MPGKARVTEAVRANPCARGPDQKIRGPDLNLCVWVVVAAHMGQRQHVVGLEWNLVVRWNVPLPFLSRFCAFLV